MKRIDMKMFFLAVVLLGVLLIASGCCIRHEWKEATCMEPSVCAECGKSQGEALGHNWQAATCARPKTCSVCHLTDGAALGHSWQDADCLTPKTCITCALTSGKALGHNWQKATCTQAKLVCVVRIRRERRWGITGWMRVVQCRRFAANVSLCMEIHLDIPGRRHPVRLHGIVLSVRKRRARNWGMILLV